MDWTELLKILAYDSWSSPETVATTLITVITALTGAITAIIGALRNYDRKKGRETCRVTGKKLKKTKTKKENKQA